MKQTSAFILGMFVGAMILNQYGNWHITEAERTEHFNEGYETAVCEVHRLQLNRPLSKCRELPNGITDTDS